MEKFYGTVVFSWLKVELHYLLQHCFYSVLCYSFRYVVFFCCVFLCVFATTRNFLTSSSSRNTKTPHHTFYRIYDNIRYKYSYVVGETPIWSLTESVTWPLFPTRHTTHSHSSSSSCNIYYSTTVRPVFQATVLTSTNKRPFFNHGATQLRHLSFFFFLIISAVMSYQIKDDDYRTRKFVVFSQFSLGLKRCEFLLSPFLFFVLSSQGAVPVLPN